MVAIALALGIQVVWDIVRAVLEHSGLAVHESYLFALAIALAAAVELVIAASAANLARRLAGRRRLGMVVAAIAYLAMAATTLAYRVLVHGAMSNPAALHWIFVIRDHGWGALEVVGIAGFAVAAGGRAVWLAPLAAGGALMSEQMTVFGGAWREAEVIACVIIKLVLLAVIVAVAEGHATAGEPDRERALRGLRRAELAAWIAAGLAGFWAAPALLLSSVRLSCALGFVIIASAGLLASAAWSTAQAMIPGLPRWPWYATATCALWALARTLGSWSVALVWEWGNFDSLHLHIVGWWVHVPQTVAWLSVVAALVVLGRRRGSRALTLTGAIGGLAIAVMFAADITNPEHARMFAACSLCTSLALVQVFRVARAEVASEIPRASLRRS